VKEKVIPLLVKHGFSEFGELKNVNSSVVEEILDKSI